jgi:hypothetical protein
MQVDLDASLLVVRWQKAGLKPLYFYNQTDQIFYGTRMALGGLFAGV